MSVTLRRCVALLLLCLFPSGCTSHSASLATPAHFVRAASPAAVVPIDAHAQAIAAVQSRPLYQQASLACQRKDYAGAAHLLQRLAASSDLTAEQQHFALEQRNLCLKDAGLPVPKLTTAVPVAAPPSVPPRAFSPEEADCGPRALLLVCNQLGVKTTLEQLRKAAGTTGKGTSMAGLAKAAQTLGLKTEGVQVSREALPQMSMPAIAWVDGRHYEAVLSLQGSGEQGTATIHDPNQPHEETIVQERLLRLSSGYLLLVHR